MFTVNEVNEEGNLLRRLGKFESVLDAVIVAYSDGNFDFYDIERDVYECYRDNGTRFYLQVIYEYDEDM